MPSSQQGMTLIELLLTLVLLAMVAGYSASGLVGQTEAARWHSLLAQASHLYPRAHAMALSRGPVVVSSDGSTVRGISARTGDLVFEDATPDGCSLVLKTEDGRGSIVFAPSPTGVRPYEMECQLGEKRRAFLVHPVTGWQTEVQL